MKSIYAQPYAKQLAFMLLAAAIMTMPAMNAQANGLDPALAAKVETYKKKLVEWAADPVVVNATKDGNAKGGIPGMDNAKWEGLSDSDPLVMATQTNEAGKLMKKLEGENKDLAKLYVRAAQGHLVAGSNKPLIYNVSTRPTFKAAIAGETWAAKEVKPDPATELKVVQISTPILDGGKVIGVLHSAVIAK